VAGDDRSKRPPLVPPFPGGRQDPREFTSKPKTNPLGIPSVPRGEFDFEVPTAVGTDVQVFHAVKALHTRLDRNEEKAAAAHGSLTREVGALKVGLDELKDVTDKQDLKLDKLAEGQAKVVGYIEGQRDASDRRSKSPSSMLRMVKQTTTETLAEQVLADVRDDKRHRRKLTLLVVGGAVTLLSSWEFLKWAFHKFGWL
jgi:hypothetical protein